MNLLQCLTNENPILIKVLTFIISIIESGLLYLTVFILFKSKFNLKNFLVFIGINSSITLVTLIFPIGNLSDILNLSTFLLLASKMFKLNIRNSLIALVVSYAGLILSSFIGEAIYMSLFKVNYHAITAIPIYYLSCMICAMFIFLFYNLVIYFVLNKKFKKISKLPLKHIIIINLIVGIIAISLISYVFTTNRGMLPFSFTLTIILTLFIYFILSIYSIFRTNLLEKTKADLENEILYNKTLSLLHDNIRSFKHDFNNIVQSIGGYIELNDMGGLKIYYSKLLEECKLTNNLNLLNPKTINNPSIYSLLTSKYYIASQKEINMNFSIFCDLSRINCNIYELTRILGILLDNAIEAAEETEEKIIDIEISTDTKKHMFIIKNSCLNSDISTTKIFEKGYSTKNRNSGIGLWKVHKILSKNTDLDLYTTIKDNIFSQQLAIYNKQ